MDNRLIFLYHRLRDNIEPAVLSEPRKGLATNAVVDNRWRDAGRYVIPGDGRPGARV
jgi:hypothetical protein